MQQFLNLFPLGASPKTSLRLALMFVHVYMTLYGQRGRFKSLWFPCHLSPNVLNPGNMQSEQGGNSTFVWTATTQPYLGQLAPYQAGLQCRSWSHCAAHLLPDAESSRQQWKIMTLAFAEKDG